MHFHLGVGLHEFTNYLRKEYSHENIRFWIAVNDLKRSCQSQILVKVKEIYEWVLLWRKVYNLIIINKHKTYGTIRGIIIVNGDIIFLVSFWHQELRAKSTLTGKRWKERTKNWKTRRDSRLTRLRNTYTRYFWKKTVILGLFGRKIINICSPTEFSPRPEEGSYIIFKIPFGFLDFKYLYISNTTRLFSFLLYAFVFIIH